MARKDDVTVTRIFHVLHRFSRLYQMNNEALNEASFVYYRQCQHCDRVVCAQIANFVVLAHHLFAFLCIFCYIIMLGIVVTSHVTFMNG